MRKRHLSEREIWEIGAKRHLTKYPDVALMTERLARKAKAEPKFSFYNLYGWVLHPETLRCAWERVKANGGAPGVDGITIQMIERSEGGVEGFLDGVRKELHEKTYRASPLRRKYIKKANGKSGLITHARNGPLTFADTYYGELNHYGMYWLKWVMQITPLTVGGGGYGIIYSNQS